MANTLLNNVLTRGAATLAGTAYDYLTPGLGSSRVTDWGAGIKTGGSGTSKPANKPTSTYNPDNTNAALSAALAESERLRQQAQAASIAAQPRLPKFDYAASYANAQATAANTVNPVYQDKLNQYMAKAQAMLSQKTTNVTRSKEDIATALAQSLEDNATGRTRTNEDTTMKIGDINATENSWQRQEGRQFDQARTALLGNVADAGLTESGIGQGRIGDVVTDRNLASEDQVRTYDNAKRDATLYQTRTLEDLDKGDVRAQSGAARSTQAQDIDLDNFIQNANLEEQATRSNLEGERIGAINSATESAFQTTLAQTIAALAGSGARAQDIALFKQIYG